MNPIVGWLLAAAGLLAGWWSYGWPGLFLAFSVIVFWLLLQFSRSLRVLRMAAQRPKGSVANAVMLQARLRNGMTLLEVLPLTASLGLRVSQEPERWRWEDASGDAVELEMRAGKLAQWQLLRAGEAAAADSAAAQPTGQEG